MVKIFLLILTFLAGMIGFLFPAYSQVTDCYATLEAWKSDASLRNFMSTHRCYCPSANSRPVCTPIGGSSYSAPSTPGGLSPSQQMQLQMFQSIMTPIFGALGSMIQQSMMDLLAPQQSSNYNISYYQQQMIKKQQEEEKKKAIESWNKLMKEAEEEAKREVEQRKKAGQNILSQVRIGSGPFGSYTIFGPRAEERETLTSIDWDSPRQSVASNVKVSAKEQLLKSLYFSKMAEASLQSGDLEAARFYASLAFEGDVISPISIKFNPPRELLDAMDDKKAAELNTQLTRFSNFYRLAMPNFEKLQNVFTELEEVKIKKEESEKKIKEIESQIREIEAKKERVQKPEEKAEADNLLAEAQALLQQAEAEKQEALKKEQELQREKQAIEEKINELKKNLLAQTGKNER